MEAKPNIIGLDLSLTATGVCLPDGDTIVIKSKEKGTERLIEIREEVLSEAILADLVILEGYSFGSRGRATFNIGELGGVARVALIEVNIPFVEVPPSCLKKYATGKGNCGKSAVVSAATHRSQREFKDDNEADAWWLWQIGLSHYNPKHPGYIAMPKENQKALDKIEWTEGI